MGQGAFRMNKRPHGPRPRVNLAPVPELWDSSRAVTSSAIPV